ncbi:hypothetical protein OQJ26_16455 [Legionella sp. PATHC038]|uniref:hypothetical protein n=1 Tax=Legionella sheltonii TaxID=2992041 RepID=UPI002244D3FE|nr:hypothetical protein [Legionella sp. PATHC038]MCW8400373.1 hypothetical protein [Legionella sp. PATHC038]
MKIVKAAQYTEIELLNLFKEIHDDALSMNKENFIRKYESFEIPEQLISFQFESKNRETILHILMNEIALALVHSKEIMNLVYFFKFLINNGADINRMSDTNDVPLSYLFKYKDMFQLWNLKYIEDFFKIINQSGLTINNRTFERLVGNVFRADSASENQRTRVLDVLISFGAELTVFHEAASSYDNFYKQYKIKYKQYKLSQEQEKLTEQLAEHKVRIQRLEQQNSLLLDNIAKLTKKVESLLNNSEKTEIENSTNEFTFFGS